MDDLELRFNFIKDLAVQAGNILSDYYCPTGSPVKSKPDRTAVSEADLSLDYFIREQISQQFPQELVLSEEGSHSYSPTQDPHNSESIHYTWIIDPLDGTTNFSMGLPIWGTLLTCLSNGYPTITALYFPQLNELYTASAGHGAYLNDARIGTTSPKSNQAYSFFACCSRTFRQYQIAVPYKLRIVGSSAYTMCLVAKGAAILGFDASPKIWDIAGACLLLAEAGKAVGWMGSSHPFPLLPGGDYAEQCYPCLAGESQGLVIKNKARITPKQSSGL